MRKISIIGDYGCGKTSLLLCAMGQKFVPNRPSTVFCDYFRTTIRIEDEGFVETDVELNMMDTCGSERYSCSPSFFRGSSVVLLCFDMSQKDQLSSVVKWKGFVEKNLEEEESTPVFLVVGCKSDLFANVDVNEIRGVCDILNTDYWITSSKNGSNIEALFRDCAFLSIFGNIKRRRSKLARKTVLYCIWMRKSFQCDHVSKIPKDLWDQILRFYVWESRKRDKEWDQKIESEESEEQKEEDEKGKTEKQNSWWWW